MAKLTYDDFKQRLSIQDVLVDAGYTLNRRDGLRYPSYVRLDSDGRRIRGDKFIVTANGQCCFQPPTQRNYNVIGFIKELHDSNSKGNHFCIWDWLWTLSGGFAICWLPWLAAYLLAIDG